MSKREDVQNAVDEYLSTGRTVTMESVCSKYNISRATLHRRLKECDYEPSCKKVSPLTATYHPDEDKVCINYGGTSLVVPRKELLLELCARMMTGMPANYVDYCGTEHVMKVN